MELYHLESDDDLIRIALHGSLDVAGVGEIETEFYASTVAQGRNTVVDLSQVSFVSSLGIGLLMGGTKGLRRKGAKLVLLAPQADVFRVLAVSGLLSILTIAHNESELSQYLSQPVAT